MMNPKGESNLDLRQITRQGSLNHSSVPKPSAALLENTKPNDIIKRKALFEMKSALLNKKEIDLRRTMAEAVADYPNV